LDSGFRRNDKFFRISTFYEFIKAGAIVSVIEFFILEFIWDLVLGIWNLYGSEKYWEKKN